MATFDKCKWVSKKKQNIHPPRRWGHSAAILDSCIYIFGGKLSSDAKKLSQPIYKLNCQTFEFERLSIQNSPSIRDSHAGVYVKKNMWIWGGCSRQKGTNDCYEFKGNYWQQVYQYGDVPLPRESHLAIALQQRWILIIGGCDDDKKFQQVFLLDTTNALWKKITIFEGHLPYRQNASISLIGGYIYIFSGLCKQEKYTNDLFKCKLNHFDYNNTENPIALQIQKIKYLNNSLAPPTRASHAAVGYKDRYLIIFGGQSDYMFPKQKDPNPQLLNDIWVYDLQNGIWQQIKPKNSQLFRPLSNFTATIYKDQIIIFGGVKQLKNFVASDELLVLQIFDQQQLINDKKISTVCGICKMIYKQIPKQKVSNIIKQHDKRLKLDLNVIYKFAKLIEHPFQAIALFVRNSYNRRANKIDITLLQINSKNVLKICDNSKSFTSNQLNNLLFQFKYRSIIPGENNIYHQQHVNKSKQQYISHNYINNIRFGGFRLGQTILFTTFCSPHQLFVALINRDSTYCYIQDLKTSKVSDNNDFIIISKVFQQIFGQRKIIEEFSTQIYILDLNRIQQFRYQLQTNQNQILYINKMRKNIFQRQLSTYLSHYFLVSPQYFSLYIQNQFVNWINIQKQSINLNRISISKLEQAYIYDTDTKQNSIILLYSENELVCKLKDINLKGIRGFVILGKQIELNIFKNGIEDRLLQQTLQGLIQRGLNEYRKDKISLKRMAQIDICELERESKK